MFHAVGDRTVHSVSFGSGTGTLVGVAGSFASWEIWLPVFEIMSPRWRVVGFDHDGVGQTKVDPAGITHDRHLETLMSVLDAQGVDRCVLAGDSNNATLAIEAVAARPERFDGLAVVSGSAWGFDRPEVRRFVDGLRTHFEQTLDFFVEVVFPEPDSDHLKDWLRDIIRRTGPAAASSIAETYYELDLRPLLDRIEVPAMVVCGALDAITGDAVQESGELADRLRGRLHVLDGVGHLPLFSAPRRVAELLEGFLAEHTR